MEWRKGRLQGKKLQTIEVTEVNIPVRSKRILTAAALCGGILLSASGAFAQGCALCYADAAAAGPQTQAALRHGILVLMIPPMFIFAGFYFLLYRRTNARREAFDDLSVNAHVHSAGSPEIVLHLN